MVTNDPPFFPSMCHFLFIPNSFLQSRLSFILFINQNGLTGDREKVGDFFRATLYRYLAKAL